MKITGFVGPAGTGKSHHATVVAYEHNIDCIIDDGILIYQNRIVAGRSAKDETNQLKATRCAVFMDKKHAADVKKALNKIAPAQLLVLGTSEHMIKRILQSLDLPPVSEYIRIEDVSTPREIATARNVRSTEGKHVIPVPTMELKPHFRGYLLDPIRSFFHKKSGGADLDSFERSVVRPVFSYYGKLSFSDRVIESLVYYAVRDMKKIRITHVRSEKSTGQMNGLILFIDVSVKPGTPQEIKKIIHTMRDRIQREIEHTTGMSLDTIKVNVTTGVTR